MAVRRVDFGYFISPAEETGAGGARAEGWSAAQAKAILATRGETVALCRRPQCLLIAATRAGAAAGWAGPRRTAPGSVKPISQSISLPRCRSLWLARSVRLTADAAGDRRRARADLRGCHLRLVARTRFSRPEWREVGLAGLHSVMTRRFSGWWQAAPRLATGAAGEAESRGQVLQACPNSLEGEASCYQQDDDDDDEHDEQQIEQPPLSELSIHGCGSSLHQVDDATGVMTETSGTWTRRRIPSGRLHADGNRRRRMVPIATPAPSRARPPRVTRTPIPTRGDDIPPAPVTGTVAVAAGVWAWKWGSAMARRRYRPTR